VVNGLKDLNVQLLCLGRVEWHAQSHESIGEPLDANAGGAMTEVRVACLGGGVVVGIDNAIQVKRDRLGNRVELVEIILAIGDISRESERPDCIQPFRREQNIR
jgi:hypothetical protein